MGRPKIATRCPSSSSPVLGHRNPSRQSSKRSTDMPFFVAEENLPLPLGEVFLFLLLLTCCFWGKDEIMSGRTPLSNRGICSFSDLGVSSNLISSALLSIVHLLSIIHSPRSE